MIAGMLNNSGWHVNHKRVGRIWRREGLKVPYKQKKQGRLWMNPPRALLRNTLPGNGWLVRAGYGISSKYLEDVLGTTAKRDILACIPVLATDLNQK